MLPVYFGVLCDIANDLQALEAQLCPSPTQYAIHALVHRFDAALDLIATLALDAANTHEAPSGLKEP